MLLKLRITQLTITTALTALFVGAFAQLASAAATYDLAPVTSGIVDQIQAALVVILPITGGILALYVAFRILKRMVKA